MQITENVLLLKDFCFQAFRAALGCRFLLLVLLLSSSSASFHHCLSFLSFLLTLSLAANSVSFLPSFLAFVCELLSYRRLFLLFYLHETSAFAPNLTFLEASRSSGSTGQI